MGPDRFHLHRKYYPHLELFANFQLCVVLVVHWGPLDLTLRANSPKLDYVRVPNRQGAESER